MFRRAQVDVSCGYKKVVLDALELNLQILWDVVAEKKARVFYNDS